MRMNPYKLKLIKQDMIRLTVAFISVALIVVLITIITINNQNEQIYLEGIAKSAPLISKDTISRLGDLYIKLNREFEFQIKERETGYANRKNKRGDIIYYGVNGKENIDEMINEDYVNGIENIEYIKNKADRKDGDSNFTDMISVINAILQANVDKYDDKIDDLFTELFWLSHTFTGESTELYPCEHGCSWCKYYCGDIQCQGEVGGNVVGFYKCDKYLGQNNEYGLMYDPFINRKRYNYRELLDKAGNAPPYTTYNMTIYEYNDIKVEKKKKNGKDKEIHTKTKKTDKVEAEDDEIFLLQRPEGFCPICSEGRETFTSTTNKIGGCITHYECHHGEPTEIIVDPEDGELEWVDYYLGKEYDDCNNPSVENARCTCEGKKRCEEPLNDLGFYTCNEGHSHYACPGHIIVTCFGHTNLRLYIKIMYYEEMLDEFKKIIS